MSGQRGGISPIRERATTLIILTLIIAVVASIGLSESRTLQVTIVNMLIHVILVIGLYVFVGNSGVFSFGHIALMAIGAYTVGVLRIPEATKSVLFPSLPLIQIPSTPATIAGGVMAALVALVIGVPLMRLSGLAAGLGTFALLSIVYIVASNLNPVTGGSTGMAGVPATTTIPTAFVWTILLLAIAWGFQQTKVCLQLRATREDEVAAQALGISIMQGRTIAFVVSAFITGVAGGLFAQFFGTFNPEAFYLKITFLVVAMLVVGGRASLSGAVVGTFFISGVTEILRQIERGISIGAIEMPGLPGLREVGVALVMLTVLLLRPRGLTGGSEISWNGITRSMRALSARRSKRAA